MSWRWLRVVPIAESANRNAAPNRRCPGSRSSTSSPRPAHRTASGRSSDHGIEFTRSRKSLGRAKERVGGAPACRLRMAGGGIAADEALSRLYSASRLFVNFFQPSFKLADKERVGA